MPSSVKIPIRDLKPATHLAILYADRGEFDRKRFSPPIDADTLGDFFRRSQRCGSFENSCDKIAQPDGLTLLAIRSNDRRKSRERAHLANAGEFNRRYLTCRISAILIAAIAVKITIAPPGTLDDFCRSRRSAYKIAKCVAGFTKTRRRRQRHRHKTKGLMTKNNRYARAF